MYYNPKKNLKGLERKIEWGLLKKINIELLHDMTISILGLQSKKMVLVH